MEWNDEDLKYSVDDLFEIISNLREINLENLNHAAANSKWDAVDHILSTLKMYDNTIDNIKYVLETKRVLDKCDEMENK